MKLRDLSRWLQGRQLEAGRWVERWARQPEFAVPYIQRLPEPAARQILAYASEWMQPQFWGSGLRLRDLKRQRIWLELPLKNKLLRTSSPAQLGAILSAAEWGFRLLWSQQTHLTDCELMLPRAEIELNDMSPSRLWLRGELTVELMESVQIGLARQGHFEWEWSMALLTPKEKQVGQVTFKMKWTSVLKLSGSVAREEKHESH